MVPSPTTISFSLPCMHTTLHSPPFKCHGFYVQVHLPHQTVSSMKQEPWLLPLRGPHGALHNAWPRVLGSTRAETVNKTNTALGVPGNARAQIRQMRKQHLLQGRESLMAEIWASGHRRGRKEALPLLSHKALNQP